MVCALQLPGRENRFNETPFDKLSSLIDALADILCPYLDFPFTFFGHSLGALKNWQRGVSRLNVTLIFRCFRAAIFLNGKESNRLLEVISKDMLNFHELCRGIN